MRITHLKLANAIKAGRNEESFLTDERFDMSLQDALFIKVVERSTDYTVITSIMNTIWMKTEEGPAKSVPRGTRRMVNAS